MEPAAEGRPGRREIALAALGLATLGAWLFHPALTGRAVFYRRDIHAFFYPRIETFVRAVAEGAWPLWDPLSAFGRPLLADPTTQAAYPFTWLNLLVTPPTYYALFAFVHCAGSGFGLHLLCRRLGLAPLPSFLAGALWSASGPFLSLIGMAPHFAAAAWMPWVLCALDRALARGNAGSGVLLGAAAAMQVLAGAGEMSLMTALLGLLLASLRLSGPLLEASARLARVGLVSLVWALALAAVQVLPTLALLRSTSRVGFEASASLGWSLHPWSLLDFLVPGLWADVPLAPEVRARLFEGREPFLPSLYLGAVAAALVGLASLSPRRRLLVVSGLGFGFFVLAALGHHTPLFPRLLLPLLPLFRFPVKYVVPAALLWSLVAAAGAEALGRPWTDRERRFGWRLAAFCLLLVAVAALAAGVAPAAQAGKLSIFAAAAAASALLIAIRSRQASCPRWVLVAVLLAALGDVASAGRSVDLLGPPQLLAHRPPVLGELGPSAAEHRTFVASHPDWTLVVRGPAGWRREWSLALGLRELLYPPTAACWGLAGSFDGDVNGFAPRELAPLAATAHGTWRTARGLRLLQMGNVAHVITLEEAPEGLMEVAALPSVFAAPLRLLRVPDPLPRAYLVARARTAKDPAEAILDPAFDFRREVLLSEGAPARAETSVFEGRARLVEHKADRLTIDVEASGPAWLVVTEMFDPGWRVSVDGAPATLRRANVLFRCVEVPAGRHQVRMRYAPSSVLWGAAVSALAWTVAVGWWLRRASVATQKFAH